VELAAAAKVRAPRRELQRRSSRRPAKDRGQVLTYVIAPTAHLLENLGWLFDGGASLERDDYSPLERQAADALRRARKLSVGPDRNDLRQLAVGLLWLHRNGMHALIEHRLQSIPASPGTVPEEGSD